MNDTWLAPATAVTLGIAILSFIIKFLFARFIKAYDERLTDVEKDILEVKKNYTQQFRDVHRKIDDNKEDIIDEIRKVIDDKHEYRIQQGRWMGSMEQKIDNLTNELRNKRP